MGVEHKLRVANLLLLSLLNLTGQLWAYDLTSAGSLFTNLTTGYNILLRPVEKCTVNVEFSALSVESLDVRSQTFSVSGWLTVIFTDFSQSLLKSVRPLSTGFRIVAYIYCSFHISLSKTWDDPRLAWTPTDFGNITEMFFTDTYIWRPELVVRNSVNGIPVIENDELNIAATYDGTVTWDPAGVYTVGCDVDITYYPFDTQSCYITISTWSYDNEDLFLLNFVDGINLEDYSENAEWTLLSTDVDKTAKSDRNDNSKTRDKLEFSFKMARKTSYYVMNVVIPPIITSFLGLMVFLLPCESGEKVGFTITVLLAMAVLLTIISAYIPTTSKHTSIFASYLVCVLFVCAYEAVVTVLVLRIHHKADRDIPVSDRVQKFVNKFLAPITCFRGLFKPRCCGKKDPENSNMATENRVKPDNLDTIALSEKKQIPLFNGRSGRDSVIIKQGFVDETDSSVDDYKEYTWAEIANMVDMVALFLGTAAMVLSTLIFMIILVGNL